MRLRLKKRGALAVALSACSLAWGEDGGGPALRGFVREKLESAGKITAPNPAAESEPDKNSDAKEALKKSREAQGLGSLHALLPRAFKMARQWSQRAALYSVQGKGPRNEKMLEPEEWMLTFGDPESLDGRFRVVFKDQIIASREGIKKGIEMSESFKDGVFHSRNAIRTSWTSNDYQTCMPVSHRFVDSMEVDKALKDAKFPPGLKNQYRISLLHPLTDNCDGLGFLSQFLAEKPIPERLRDRSLWIISNQKETLFLDAETGIERLRRPRKSPY